MPTYWCNFPSLFAKIVKILTTTKNYLVAKISVKPEQQSQNASFFCMAPPHNWRLQTLILVWQNSTLDVRCLRKIRTRYATLSTFAQLLLRARRTDSRFTERMNVDLQNIVQLELKIVKFPICICMIVSWTFQNAEFDLTFNWSTHSVRPHFFYHWHTKLKITVYSLRIIPFSPTNDFATLARLFSLPKNPYSISIQESSSQFKMKKSKSLALACQGIWNIYKWIVKWMIVCVFLDLSLLSLSLWSWWRE